MSNSTLLSLLDITGAPARNEAQMPGYELKSDAECGCPNCHRVFSSERAFDRHRIDDYSESRKCAENFSSVGLQLDSRGRWRAVT